MQNQHHEFDQGPVADRTRMPFASLVRCADCQSSRPMVIKALRPAMVGDSDRVTYRCTACGAERAEWEKQGAKT